MHDPIQNSTQDSMTSCVKLPQPQCASEQKSGAGWVLLAQETEIRRPFNHSFMRYDVRLTTASTDVGYRRERTRRRPIGVVSMGPAAGPVGLNILWLC